MIITNINKHILEVKNRLILLTLMWSTTIYSCYLFKEIILYNIITIYDKLNPYFIITEVTELFNIYFKISFFIGNQLLILFCIYHIGMFLFTGLYKREINILKIICQIILVVFILSFLFTQFFTMPIMSKFFFQFQNSLNSINSVPIFFEAKLKEYIDFYINMYTLTLMSFSVIIILFQFIQTLSLTFKKMKRIRKLFYFIFLIFATIVTPPDVISQLVLTSLLALAYESILLINEIILINKATN